MSSFAEVKRNEMNKFIEYTFRRAYSIGHIMSHKYRADKYINEDLNWVTYRGLSIRPCQSVSI